MPVVPGLSTGVTVTSLREVPELFRTCEMIDTIFAETSGKTRFESEAARAAFRERWLGRYLAHYPDQAYVALAEGSEVVGYLVGCLGDPVRNQLFSDISYFADFAHLTRRFPAHLHINLTAKWRGLGIGKRLIATFAAHAAESGAPGMHVVTGDGARNIRFYASCGFRQLGSATWYDNPIVFLGRELALGSESGAPSFLGPARSANLQSQDER